MARVLLQNVYMYIYIYIFMVFHLIYFHFRLSAFEQCACECSLFPFLLHLLFALAFSICSCRHYLWIPDRIENGIEENVFKRTFKSFNNTAEKQDFCKHTSSMRSNKCKRWNGKGAIDRNWKEKENERKSGRDANQLMWELEQMALRQHNTGKPPTFVEIHFTQ